MVNKEEINILGLLRNANGKVGYTSKVQRNSFIIEQFRCEVLPYKKAFQGNIFEVLDYDLDLTGQAILWHKHKGEKYKKGIEVFCQKLRDKNPKLSTQQKYDLVTNEAFLTAMMIK